MCHNSLPHIPSSDRPDHIFVFVLFIFPLVYLCEFYENLDFPFPMVFLLYRDRRVYLLHSLRLTLFFFPRLSSLLLAPPR